MFTRLITFFIFLYQKVISPLKPACCRFYPSCSEYMIRSIENKGFIKGGMKGILRLFRCHPFHPGGYDPV